MEVGNNDIWRDFGYAPAYVEGMYLMMQTPSPADYILCSGESVKLRNIIEYIFQKLNIDKSSYSVSKDLYRPADIENIYGDPTRAKKNLGWNYSLNYEQLLDKLMSEELQNAE